MRLPLKRAASSLALVVAISGAVPSAEAESARDRARQLFLQGRELYNQKRYPAALARFERAARLYRSYKIDLSIGFTLEKLRRLPAAAACYERFLLDRTNRASARTRRKVAAKLRRLRRRLAMVRVGRDLRGATIEIDGARRGKAPLRHRLYVRPGTHLLAARSADRALYSKRVVLRPGRLFWIRAKGSDGEGAELASDKIWVTSRDAEEERRRKRKATVPFYKKWWFWTAVGAVAAGAAVGIAVGVGSGKDSWMPTGDSGTVDLTR